MSHLHRTIIAAMVFVALCASCAPLVSPAGPQAQAVAKPTRTPAVAPSRAAVTESLAPVTLPAPPMQVGSLYRYFDGALLDAVPNDGPFLMGSKAPESPEHQVIVNDFWIYSTEVTNQMYAWCVGLGKCTPPDVAADPGYADAKFLNYPVVGVTWQQASDYCSFAHGRLPTEAEWEKAASWDAMLKQKRIYPWGDHRPTCGLLNYRNCLFKSAPVTDYGQSRSYYGAVNMAGNVYEWVSDWYGADYYASSPAQNPLGPDTGTRRVVRSSAFGSDGYMVDLTWRSSERPGDTRADLGFRCVVEDPVYFAPYCSKPVFYGANTSNGSAVPAQECPSPTVKLGSYGGKDNTPVVNVTVNYSPPTIVTIDGMQDCTPASADANKAHQCPVGTKIQVEASCPVNPAGSPACPVNYMPDPNNPNRCVSPGGVGACPAGFQYDDSLKCCSAVAGNSAAVPLCAVGQRAYNGVCVDDVTGPRAPHSLSLVTSSGLTCTP